MILHLHSGKVVYPAADLHIRGRGLDFVGTRKYRSRLGPNTAQGNGWDFSYNIRLDHFGGHLLLSDGNTRQDLYLRQPEGEKEPAPDLDDLPIEAAETLFKQPVPVEYNPAFRMISNPNGVASFGAPEIVTTPLGLMIILIRVPRVARGPSRTGQPRNRWAE